MSQNEFADWSDDDLVVHVRTKAPPEGSGAAAELTRRQMLAMRALTDEFAEASKQARSLKWLTWALLIVTVAVLAVAVVQVARG